MPSRTPFGLRATAHRGDMSGPPDESVECSFRRFAVRTVNCPNVDMHLCFTNSDYS